MHFSKFIGLALGTSSWLLVADPPAGSQSQVSSRCSRTGAPDLLQECDNEPPPRGTDAAGWKAVPPDRPESGRFESFTSREQIFGAPLSRRAGSEGSKISFVSSRPNSGQSVRLRYFPQAPRDTGVAPIAAYRPSGLLLPSGLEAVWPSILNRLWPHPSAQAWVRSGVTVWSGTTIAPGTGGHPPVTLQASSIRSISIDPSRLSPNRTGSAWQTAIAPDLQTCALAAGDLDNAKGPIQGASNPAPNQFTQVHIGNTPIVQMPNTVLANGFARQIEQALQDPNFDAEQIKPTRIKGRPAGQAGDRLLFALPPDLAQNWTCNADQFTIQWINRLRLALGKTPLELAYAQSLLYDLREGAERLQLRASWYGPYFHGRQTATGDFFNQHGFTAAHPSLPFDTYLKVTNPRNGKSVIVRINDRGPYVSDRNLDLSWEAARAIDSDMDGVVALDAVIMEPHPSQARASLELAHLETSSTF